MSLGSLVFFRTWTPSWSPKLDHENLRSIARAGVLLTLRSIAFFSERMMLVYWEYTTIVSFVPPQADGWSSCMPELKLPDTKFILPTAESRWVRARENQPPWEAALHTFTICSAAPRTSSVSYKKGFDARTHCTDAAASGTLLGVCFLVRFDRWYDRRSLGFKSFGSSGFGTIKTQQQERRAAAPARTTPMNVYPGPGQAAFQPG